VSCLKQAHLDVFSFVLREAVSLRPSFPAQIGDDVLPGGWPRFSAKQPDGFLNPSRVVPFLAVAHPVFRAAREFIQPAMDLTKWFAEELHGFGAMLFK
jgi:hypothetical protein